MSNKVDIIKLSEIEEDPLNANRHTERGQWMVGKSIEKFGFAEAGTLDKNNRIIGGHLRTEVAADVLGSDEAIVIDVDGRKPVFIRRVDLDLDDPGTKELGIALNRTPQISIEFDPEIMETLHDLDVDLGNWFSDKELDELFAEEVDFGGLDASNQDTDQDEVLIELSAPPVLANEIMTYLEGLKRKGVTWKRL